MSLLHADSNDTSRRGAAARRVLAGGIAISFAAFAIWTYLPGTWRLCDKTVTSAPESTKTIAGPSSTTTEISKSSSSTAVACRSTGLADAWPAAVLIVVLLSPEVAELTVGGLFTLKFRQRIEAQKKELAEQARRIQELVIRIEAPAAAVESVTQHAAAPIESLETPEELR